MSYETVTFERRGPIGLLTLNRPDKLNAINQTMVAEIGQALDVAEADDDVRVVVLNGAGRSFCAGFDLGQPGSEKKKGVLEWRQILTEDFDMILRFWELSKPTISAVHGYVLAGGFEMAISCDVTISDESAMFGEPELKFGAGIVVMLLPWMTGPKQAKELLLTGTDRIGAEQALAMGLVNRVVPVGEEVETAMALARQMAVMAPDLVRQTKRAINESYRLKGLDAALEAALAIDLEIEGAGTDDKRRFLEITRDEGLRAAIAWRDSRFAENR